MLLDGLLWRDGDAAILLRRWLVLGSVVAYALACLFPCVRVSTPDRLFWWRGYELAVMGPFGIVTFQSIAWLANLGFLAGLLHLCLYWTRPSARSALYWGVWSVAAVPVALTTLFLVGMRLSYGPGGKPYGVVVDCGFGFWMWIVSLLAMALAMVQATVRAFRAAREDPLHLL